ncbi:MAG: phosphatase PAP2 family protein [Clostridia bacterium]|jgi:undecaprenyl-diphosphatase|nr:phosphatase PAP2 family protein [Clostridia bacterium]
MKEKLKKVDRELYVAINNRYDSRIIKLVMLIITFLGGVTVSIAMPFALYFMGNKELFLKMTLGLIVITVIVQSIKIIYKRTRPYEKVEGSVRIGCKLKTYSFPSGHTSTSFMLMTLLAINFGMPIAILFLSTAVLIGVSRIYLGVHYPVDVIVGAFLGTIVAISINIFGGVYIWENVLNQILKVVQLSI